jgi:ferredoxin--NADP+ reductase
VEEIVFSQSDGKYLVAVIGAGPAGLYAAKQLAAEGTQVVLFNRDIKPGGLAEYGIYYNKYKMKAGLRKQFRSILASEQINYLGNVTIGQNADLSLENLRELGFQAILVTVGAQGTKWLGLPGEDLKGVYHAKDLVYHYNQLPPFSERDYPIGRRVALIGVGNVMVDIAHWVVRDKEVDQVIAIARRGPAEVKFTKKEMENVAKNLNLEALEIEFDRVRPIMEAVGQDPQKAKEYILSALPKAKELTSHSCFCFHFFSSIKEIRGDEQGRVRTVELYDTKLLLEDGVTRSQKIGSTHFLNVDTVVFCIGDKVDASFGLPVQWDEFVKDPAPRFPVDGASYEVFDPQAGEPINDVFLAGWARKASSGLVGVARKDGVSGAKAVLKYLASLAPIENKDTILSALNQKIAQLPHPVVDKDAVLLLDDLERAEAEAGGLEYYRFGSNSQMLRLLGHDK